MLIGMMVANGACLLAGALLLRALMRPPADRTPVESFAAVLQAIRPTGGYRSVAAPTWIPWTRKGTRTC